MPFTVDAVGKKIDFEFIAGDPKGNSLANAVTQDDYQAAMVAAGEGAGWTKQGNQHLLDGWSISITGVDTWVHFYNCCIEWTGAVTQGYLISITAGSNFYIGSDSGVTQRGCILMANQTAAKSFIFRYNTYIYECTFQSTTNQNYHLWFTSSAGSPVTLKRCQFINVGQIGTVASGYALSNVIFDDNLIVGAYGIYYKETDDFLSIENLKAIGRIAFMYSINATKTGRNWICPDGTMSIRAYYSYQTGINLIDCVVGNITLVTTTLTAGYVGAKAFVDQYSTFSFYIENGENATVKVWNKNDVLLLDSVLDASGELEGQELKYWERSNTKTQDNPNEYVAVNEKYTPFRVEVIKTDRKTLIIDGINVVDGSPTNIFGTMEFPELLISAVAITDCTAIGASDGSLEITAEGGDGSYTYSINGVDYQASNTFSGLSAGDYTVYVKDGEGTITTFDVTISQPIPEAYAEDVLTCDLTEESLDCDLAEEVLTCDFIE